MFRKTPWVAALILLTTLLAISAHAEEKATQTVVVTGVGDSVETAAQNAAENALTQVVGSFVDTETLLEKKTEIENGVRQQTREINTKTREYSQGSIKYFEVLEARQKKGLYRVTAKVVVRVENFRAYIKKVAEGSVSLDEGLFAELSTESGNVSDKRELLKDTIIAPLVKSEVVKFSVGKPVSLNNALNSGDDNLRNSVSQLSQTGLISENAFVIPVEATIDPAFWDNMLKKLDSIADQKVADQETSQSPCLRLQTNTPTPSRAYIAVGGKGAVMQCYGINHALPNRQAQISDSSSQMTAAIERALGFDAYGGILDLKPLMPDLMVSFIGSDGSPISEHLVSRNNVDGREYPRDDVSNPNVIIIGGWSGVTYLGGTKSILYVGHKWRMIVVVALPLDELKAVKKIKLKVSSR
jgi:hypothetical protein